MTVESIENAQTNQVQFELTLTGILIAQFILVRLREIQKNNEFPKSLKVLVLAVFLVSQTGCSMFNRNREQGNQFPDPTIVDPPMQDDREEIVTPEPAPIQASAPVEEIETAAEEVVVPTGPPPFPSSGWNCTANISSLDTSLLNRFSGEWRMNPNIEPATARIQSFTVLRTDAGLSVTAMGFTFDNATVCTNNTAGFYRITVQTMIGPKVFNIRLDGSSRLVSYSDGEPNGTFERLQSSEVQAVRSPAAVET